jgi:archaellum component FlaC
MSKDDIATKKDIDKIIELINDFMDWVDERFNRLEARFDHLEGVAGLHVTSN